MLCETVPEGNGCRPCRPENRRNKLKRNVSSDISRSGFLHRMDWLLLILVTICAGASVVMLRALWTQNITAEVDSNDWIVQLISMALGIAGCITVAAIDYHKLAKFWFLYVPPALALCALTFTSLGYGREGADDRAWIDFGFVQVQPSEILKLVFLLTYAFHISKVRDKLNQPVHLFLLLLHAGGSHHLVESSMKAVEWATIFFFIGLFIAVGGLIETGIIGSMASQAVE